MRKIIEQKTPELCLRKIGNDSDINFRLKKFMRNKIIKENNPKNRQESKTLLEKERLLSATDSAMRSTNTTNFLNTNTKFFKAKNETAKEEIKSSYSKA